MNVNQKKESARELLERLAEEDKGERLERELLDRLVEEHK